MTTLARFHGMLFQASDMVPKGMQLLWNEGHPVLCARIGAPIEDAVCDEIWLNPIDYEHLKNSVTAA